MFAIIIRCQQHIVLMMNSTDLSAGASDMIFDDLDKYG